MMSAHHAARPGPILAAGRGMRLTRLSPRAATVLSLVTMVVVWHVISALAGSNSSGDRNVPNLVDIATSAKKLGYYWRGGYGVEATNVGGDLTWAGAALSLVFNSAATLLRLVVGVAVGCAFGVGLAVLVSWSPTARRIFILPAHLARMLPMLALVSLFALWFGSSESGAVLFVAFAAFTTIFFVALVAIANVPAFYQQRARSLGASRLRSYVSVVVPAAVPDMRAGFMLALGFGWSAVIAAELLGMQSGLGRIVNLAQFYGLTDILALIAALTAVYAGTTYYLATKLFNHLTRWAESST